MHRVVVTAVTAVVLGITASPAVARPLYEQGQAVEPVAACARLAVTATVSDCTVHACKPRHRKHRHHKHHARKHLCAPARIQ